MPLVGYISSHLLDLLIGSGFTVGHQTSREHLPRASPISIIPATLGARHAEESPTDKASVLTGLAFLVQTD